MRSVAKYLVTERSVAYLLKKKIRG